MNLPPPPKAAEPGTVYGRVVYAQPGQATRQPAAGASITVLGTGLSATAGADGNFLLSGIIQSTGTLLFRFDSTGSGRVDHQRIIDLQDIGAGLGRQIGLGEVAVVENARMHGTVLLEDKAEQTTGHGNTTVFVPAGPYTTYTNDDGSYSLDELPEGKIRITIFHEGYDPVTLDDVDLRSGEDFAAQTITLKKSAMAPPPGSISGKIDFIPKPASTSAIVIAAIDTVTASVIPGMLDSDGTTFHIRTIPAGLYDLSVSLSGYSTALIHHVLVATGSDVVLPDVVLQAGNGTTVCNPGDDCTPSTACRVGKIDCSTGAPICKESGNAMDGQLCGTDMVCNAGSCTACKAGDACAPDTNACHVGVYSCSTGKKVCVDEDINQMDGLTCGAGQVCHQGTCTACPQGASCMPENACHTGAIDCSTGSPLCKDSGGTLMNGTSCGQDQVCNGGVCVACAAGSVCTPVTSLCHKGTYACDSGTRICIDTGDNLTDGTGCGQDQVCNGGNCVACVTGASCVPPGNVCHAGVTSCATGVSVCQDTMSPAAEGTPCDTAKVCHQGACVPTGFIVMSGDKQSATVDGIGSFVTIVLNDQNGAPMVNAMITITPPPGGAALPSTVTTDLQGRFTFSPQMPRQPGTYTYAVSSPGQGSISITATATAAATGTVYSIVNPDHSYGNDGVPGPGTHAHINAPRDIAVASDGTLYYAESGNAVIRKLSPAGDLSNVAGTGAGYSYGYSGDGGLATMAQLYNPLGVALDEAHQLLYIADSGNNVVRMVDLTSGLITTVAGGGKATDSAYGDGAAARNAVLNNPNHVAVGPDGMVYISDNGHGRIRRYNPSTGIISGWVQGIGGCTSGATTIALYDCNYYGGTGCSVAWDAAGTAYISGTIVGTDAGGSTCTTTPGVLRVNGDGSFTHIAGLYNGTIVDGRPAASHLFGQAPTLAFDAAGNLFLADASTSTIHKVDAASGSITTVGGVRGTNGYAGSYQPATSSQFYSPWGIAFDSAQNLYIADDGNHTVRTIASVGSATVGAGMLTVASGDGQSTPVETSPANLLRATLVDENGAPLSGYYVSWTAVDEGGAVYAPWSTTDNSGTASIQVRVGRQPGAYRFQASYRDLHGNPVTGSPVTFTLTATAQPDGTIYTIVNSDHTSGNSGIPGAGPLARVGTLTELILASNGDIYFTDSQYNMVRKLSAHGQLTNIAGNGSYGYSGDGGPALSAQLNDPWGLALDEKNQLLYVSEYYNKVIRRIDLKTNIITTYAGGGSSQGPGYGDGGSVTNAVFGNPTHLAFGPDGLLYVSDYGYDRIRRIDTKAGTINAWLTGTKACGNGNLTLWNCGGGYTSCQVTWDTAGNAYVAGNLTGNAITYGGCTQTPGVMRINKSDGSTSLIAGHDQGTTTDNQPASQTYFDNVPTIAVDSGGNVYLANNRRHTIQRVEAESGRLVTLAGAMNNANYSGDGTPASSALLNTPWGIVIDSAQNILFVDSANDAIRTIARGASTAPYGAALGLASGDQQTPFVSQTLAKPLSVELVDGTGMPLVGYTVRWSVVESGAGLYNTTSKTDLNGVATVQARVGWTPGTYHFKASYQDLQGNDIPGSPVVFTATAQAPATGTIFTVVNGDHSSANTGIPGPAAIARVGYGEDLAIDSSGNIYFTDVTNHQVDMVTPQGQITVVAGSGGYGYSGDGGLATAAKLNTPAGLAIDNKNQVLYIAEYNNNVIRAVSLQTGVISTFAGGGNAPSPGYGDSGPPAAAVFNHPTHLAFGPDGGLYVSDIGHEKIRRIDMAMNTINTWFNAAQGYYCGANTLIMNSCDGAGAAGCQVVWDGQGNVYISGVLAGTAIGGGGGNCGTTAGILKIPLVGGAPNVAAETAFAGYFNGSSADGIAATAAAFKYSPTMTFDGNGNLIVADYNAHRVRSIDTTGKITTIAGNGTAAYAGDYVASTTSQVNQPWGVLALPGGHLLFADSNNFCLREIW